MHSDLNYLFAFRVWTDSASFFFFPLNFSLVSFLFFFLSHSALPKYPRPLPIPYADVHPVLLSIQSHIMRHSHVHDGAQIRSTIERRNCTVQWTIYLNFSYILLRKSSIILRCFAISIGAGLRVCIIYLSAFDIRFEISVSRHERKRGCKMTKQKIYL